MVYCESQDNQPSKLGSFRTSCFMRLKCLTRVRICLITGIKSFRPSAPRGQTFSLSNSSLFVGCQATKLASGSLSSGDRRHVMSSCVCRLSGRHVNVNQLNKNVYEPPPQHTHAHYQLLRSHSSVDTRLFFSIINHLFFLHLFILT